MLALLAGLLYASPVLFNCALANINESVPTSIYVTICGNNIIEPGEFCDDGVNNRAYVNGGSLNYCNLECSGWAPSCGDAIVQPEFGETCDHNNSSCTEYGYYGIKACSPTCNAWLACHTYEYCGDGVTNGSETCDINTRTCISNGYRGSQSCLTDCSGYGNCVTSGTCGDNVINGNEECDGNSQSCLINNYNGTQTCNDTCSGWNTCIPYEYCGDGVINGDEECDGGSKCSPKCEIKSSESGGSGGGGGSSSSSSTTTKVIIQGKAYPNSTITVLKDGDIATVVKADSAANFKAEVTDIKAGLWTFGLWSEDKFGNRSITFSFTFNVNANIISTVNGIFLPPTISIDKTILKKGETLNVVGQSAPKSTIDLTVNSEDPGITNSTKADEYGLWTYPFDTTPLEEGSHTARAKATGTDGSLSGYSNMLSFVVGNLQSICSKNADINLDKRVNLVDFSILLYNWAALKNSRADINCDGKASLVDFSIMMYQWTG